MIRSPQLFILSLTVLALYIGGTTLASKPAPTMEITLQNLRVTTINRNGKTTEKLSNVSGRATAPGQILQLQYTLNKSQVGGEVRNVKVDINLPIGSLYLSNSCGDFQAQALFSTDGETFGTAPLTKTITVTENEASVSKEVTISPSEYTTIRWQIPSMEPGQKAICLIRVRMK